MTIIPKDVNIDEIPLDKKIDILKHTYSDYLIGNQDIPESEYYDTENRYNLYSGDRGNFADWIDPTIYMILQYPLDYIYIEGNPKGVESIGYRPLQLKTYYPYVHPWYNEVKDKNFKYTGHSVLNGVTKSFSNSDYNLLLNNCSDETRRALEAIFDKSADVNFFTTPGDVRDFALENGGYSKDRLNRIIYIPMNKERLVRWKTFLKNRFK